ncbi:MAG: hypothetical protein ACXADB_04600 [Candidatus Hermodarchaeia archaeon]
MTKGPLSQGGVGIGVKAIVQGAQTVAIEIVLTGSNFMRCQAYYIRKNGNKVLCDLEDGHDGAHHIPKIVVKIVEKEVEKSLGRKSKYKIGSAMDILADWKTGL